MGAWKGMKCEGRTDRGGGNAAHNKGGRSVQSTVIHHYSICSLQICPWTPLTFYQFTVIEIGNKLDRGRENTVMRKNSNRPVLSWNRIDGNESIFSATIILEQTRLGHRLTDWLTAVCNAMNFSCSSASFVSLLAFLLASAPSALNNPHNCTLLTTIVIAYLERQGAGCRVVSRGVRSGLHKIDLQTQNHWCFSWLTQPGSHF